MILDEDIERVKSSVNMVQLAEYYGFKVNRSGYICCPFHNDKHPSMRVFSGYLSKDGYICRACGAGGTIFNFVMEYEGICFEDAVRKIGALFSIPISSKEKDCNPEIKIEYSHKMKALEIEKKIHNINRTAMIELSDRIQLYERLMIGAKPFGRLFCYIANRLPVMRGEWEARFEVEYGEK